MAYSYTRARRTVHRQIKSFGSRFADQALLVRTLPDGTVQTRKCRAARLEYKPTERRLFEDGSSRILISGLSLTLNGSEPPDNQLDMIYFAGALYKIILPIDGFRQDPSTVIFYDCNVMYSQKAEYLKGEVNLGPITMGYGFEKQIDHLTIFKNLKSSFSFGFDMLTETGTTVLLTADMAMGFSTEALVVSQRIVSLTASMDYGFGMLADAGTTQNIQAPMSYGFDATAKVETATPGVVNVSAEMEFGYDMSTDTNITQQIKAAMSLGFDMLAAARTDQFIAASMATGFDQTASVTTSVVPNFVRTLVGGDGSATFARVYNENWIALAFSGSVPGSSVSAAALSDNGLYGALATESSVFMYDMSTGVPTFVSGALASPPSWSNIRFLAFSPDSKYLAIADPSTSPYVFIYEKDAVGDGWTAVSAPAVGEGVYCIDWHPSGNRIAFSRNTSGWLREYNWPANTLRTALPSIPSANCITVAYSPNGNYLAATFQGDATGLHVWELAGNTKLAAASGAAADPVVTNVNWAHGMAWDKSGMNANGRIIVASANSPYMTIYEFTSSTTLTKMTPPVSLPQRSSVVARFEKSGGFVLGLFGGASAPPYLHRYSHSLIKQRIETPNPTDNNVRVIAPSPISQPPKQQVTITGFPASPYFHVMNAEGAVVANPGGTNPATTVVAGNLDPNERWMALATATAVYIYDLHAADYGVVPNALSSPPSWSNVQHVLFSPDGRYLSICDPSMSPYLWVYEKDAVGNGWTQTTAPNLSGGVASCASWSPDGSRLAVGLSVASVPSLREYNWPANTLRTALSSVPAAFCRCVAYSPSLSDGGHIAATFDDGADSFYVWRLDTGARLTVPAGTALGTPNALPYQIAWARSGVSVVALGGQGGTGRTMIWYGVNTATHTLSRLSDPATMPPTSARTVTQLRDGSVLVGFQNTSTPRLYLYSSARVKQTDPAGQPTANPYFVASTF